MKTLEQRIRESRPEPPELPPDFGESLFHRLKGGEKPAWQSRLAWGWALPGLLGLVPGGLFFGAALYWVRMSGALEMLPLGPDLFFPFLANLPWGLLSLYLVLTGLSSLLVWRSALLQRGLALIMLILFSFTSLGGGLVAARQEELPPEEESWHPLHWVLPAGPIPLARHHHFRMGRVASTGPGWARLDLPDGRELRLDLPQGMQVKEGDFLRLLGEGSDGEFKVKRGQHCDPRRMGRYFGKGRGQGPGHQRGMRRGHGPGMGPMHPGMNHPMHR